MEEEKYITKKGEEINIVVDPVKDDEHSDNYHTDDWSVAIAIKGVGKRIEYKLSEETRSCFSSDAVKLLKTKFKYLSLIMYKISLEKDLDNFEGGVRLIQSTEIKNSGDIDGYIKAREEELKRLVA